MLLRLHGNYLEAVGALEVPTNPGTPGQINSRHISNAGPALEGVYHAPALPAAQEDVVVTVDVVDPDGVSGVYLKYRTDPATSYTTVTMLDNGTGGDEISGDGVYSGTIPGVP